MKSADVTAKSAPEDKAIPISAIANAGASLIPSPTIATTWFGLLSLMAFTCSCLSSGNTSATIRSSGIPMSFPISNAVILLSPVIIQHSMSNFVSTLSWPYVNVPVLSKQTTFVLAASWKAAPPPLTKTPFLAAKLAPTNNAVGAAKPIPQGQAMTKTAMANSKDHITQPPMSTSKYDSGKAPDRLKANQMTKVRMAMRTINGTK